MEVRAGYKKTEVGVLPIDWECNDLQKYFSFISYGFTNPMPTVTDGVYMITANDVNEGRIKFETARKTTEMAFKYLLSDKSRPKKNDILLTKDGSLGRLAMVCDEKICINQSVAVIRPNERVNPLFLKLLLEDTYYQRTMIDNAGGSTIKHIYITIVNKMQVGIPPTKAEQTAIATALSDADALISSLEKLIEKKRNIKQGAMQKLLQPKEGWVVKKLGEIAEIYQPQTISQNVFIDDGYLVYGANGVVGKYHLFNHETWQTTITCRGSTCGTVNRTEGKSWITGNAMVMNVDKNNTIDKLFFYYILKKQNFSQCITGSGQPQIVRNPLFDFNITIPKSKQEQNTIAVILADMDSEITALETKLEKYRNIKLGMMQNLLTGRIRLI